MSKNSRFHNLLTVLVVTVFAIQMTGCGTLMYPERQGQTSGRIDATVAILDGIGLLFFIIPGLIAYAVDFSTGAIYLPSESSSAASEGIGQLAVVYTNPDRLNRENIEEIIAEVTGHSISLDREDIVVSKLESPEQVLEQYDRLVESGEIPQR
jgi:hypothetical protein